jgi:hypothetical protein
VNLPWLQYGGDFGANVWQPDGGVGRPERRERLSEVFGRLADRNLTVVLWFVLCDGRAGVRFADDGSAAGRHRAQHVVRLQRILSVNLLCSDERIADLLLV